MVPWVVVGLMAGIGGASIGQLWWESLRPIPIVILTVNAVSLDDGGYKLVVRMKAPKTPDCLRLSEHILSPEPIVQGDEFLPLASVVGGGGFTSTGPVVIDLKIHPGMVAPGSTWYYTYRAVYQCTKFPGFLRFSGLESAPVRVTF